MAVKTFSSNTVLSSSDVNTYLTNGGLVYITEGSATTGTTLTIDSCFTSTYDAYRLVISNLKSAAASTGVTMVLRASGTDAATNYAYGYAHQALYTSTALTISGTTTGTSFDLLLKPDTIGMGAIIDLINPNLAEWTTMTSSGIFGGNTAGNGIKQVSGIHATASAYDGFKLTLGGSTFSNIKCRVYGYRQS